MTAMRRRGWNQFVELSFVVGALLAIIEVVFPAFGHQLVDWREAWLLCGFGLLVVLGSTMVAYLRPPEHDEAADKIELAARIIERELYQHRISSQMAQMKQWAAQDPTWRQTSPEHHAVNVMTNQRNGSHHTQPTLPEHSVPPVHWQTTGPPQQTTGGYRQTQRTPGR